MHRFTPSFSSRRRAFAVFSLAGALALGSGVLGACNNDPVIQPVDCTPGNCTCDQDPTQPACRAFNDRPEGGKDPADATPVDAFVPDTMPDLDASDDSEAGGDGGDI